MAGPIITDFHDKLIEIVNETSLRGRIERLWLGGTAGPSGGQGQRPGGYIGQLNQTLSSYDTDELATITGSGSLLDNLNHIRHNIATVSGMIADITTSGTITIREIDNDPTVSGVTIVTFSGATIIDNGNGEAIVIIPSGGYILTIVEADGSPEITSVNKITFSGATVTDNGSGEVTVTITASGTSSVQTFLDLTDTPNDYIGQAGKVPTVKFDETGLEFTTVSGISGSGDEILIWIGV